ncbi:peroxidase superfamily protein [Actinidia rufa]|uniref:peroxidase n=1 Tax=Actinidia rufa TaxID=165716 RepID=A0A7J0EM87_9ERIC|nr:peroxidase superfamily protein [Actinidia rufa]
MIMSPNEDAEKDAQDNLSLAEDGFDTVIKAKQAVEDECRGGSLMTLMYILTMAAREVIALLDMIALSGAHTVGFSHCDRFANRLYLFSPSSPVNPSLDPAYAQQLMQAGKGLFTSDDVLFTNSVSQPAVSNFLKNPSAFNGAFITAMRKLGRVGVKTGSQGEIRRDCTAFN